MFFDPLYVSIDFGYGGSGFGISGKSMKSWANKDPFQVPLDKQGRHELSEEEDNYEVEFKDYEAFLIAAST